MSIKIYPNTKVYVVAPANTATGGPELLHQLVYNLRKILNINAYMYYIPDNHPNPIHPAYKQYNIPFVNKIEDKKENLLIVPEVAKGISVLLDYSKIRKAIWWLSVDNFYLSMFLSSKRKFFIRRAINKVSSMIFKREIFDIFTLVHKRIPSINLKDISEVQQANFHLVQSYYSFYHLKEKGIPEEKILYLSDYLNENFLKIKVDLYNKENIVVYNPKKGFSFTKMIIESALEIKFVPLINMTREQVIETLQKAKVYIDFGNHPGKDRIPREAAILGCCVIVGKNGSAKFYEDVPIENEFKYDVCPKNIPLIVKKIRNCFDNYEKEVKKFEKYTEIIKNEQSKFIEDIKNIFQVSQ